jgi:hypothetical protein
MANALMVEYHKSVVGHASSSRPVGYFEDLSAYSVTASTCCSARILNTLLIAHGDAILRPQSANRLNNLCILGL